MPAGNSNAKGTKMKRMIVVFVVCAAVMAAAGVYAATNTWSGVRVFTLSVSNQPNGQAIRYAAHIPVTNIWITPTSGELWVRPADFNARVGDTMTNAYTYVGTDSTLIVPAIDRTYFYVRTTNAANNVIAVELK